MTVLLGTGMRVAECTGITKSDINLSENTISVNHNLIYRVIDGKAGFHITTPKTESGTRIIPILYPEVAEQLRLQIKTIDALYPDDQLVLGGVHGFVFRNRTGSFMSAHNINRAIESTPSVPGSAKAPTMLNSFSKSWGMPISLLQWTSTPISHKRICRRRQKTLV